MKRTFKTRLTQLTTTLMLAGLTGTVAASDFNLPFINASGLGTAYADWATATDDASVAFSNPAALVKLQHQQVVFAPMLIAGNTRFTGTSTSPPPPFPLTQTGSAGSHLGAMVPSLYYASPMWNKFVFALSETVPFALGTTYSKTSVVRYIATKSQVVVFDVGPSVGYKISDQLSVGLGLDAARLSLTLNHMVRSPFGGGDFESQSHVAGWGYGWHGGVLYQPLPMTRVGLSFNSMLMFHATGDSESYSPFGTTFRTTNQKTYAALPARTQLSVHQDLTDRVDVMGSLFYTNWSTLNKVTLQNVMLPTGTTIRLSIPFEYHNTFDYAAGITFKATPKWLLRTGVEYMTTPSNGRDRAVSDPVGSAIVVGLGALYQQSAALGCEFSVGHSFFQQPSVNFTTPVATLVGHNKPQTTVLGAQINWNII